MTPAADDLAARLAALDAESGRLKDAETSSALLLTGKIIADAYRLLRDAISALRALEAKQGEDASAAPPASKEPPNLAMPNAWPGLGQQEAVYVIFDGPPGPEAGRFVEVETDSGKSVRVGEWTQSEPYWRLGPFYTASKEPPAAPQGGLDDCSRITIKQWAQSQHGAVYKDILAWLARTALPPASNPLGVEAQAVSKEPPAVDEHKEFEKWWKDRPRGIYTDQDYALLAWQARAALAKEKP